MLVVALWKIICSYLAWLKLTSSVQWRSTNWRVPDKRGCSSSVTPMLIRGDPMTSKGLFISNYGPVEWRCGYLSQAQSSKLLVFPQYEETNCSWPVPADAQPVPLHKLLMAIILLWQFFLKQCLHGKQKALILSYTALRVTKYLGRSMSSYLISYNSSSSWNIFNIFIMEIGFS